MARKKADVNAKMNSLRLLIATWGKNKTESDALGKIVKKDADEIKKLMQELKLSDVGTDKYIAKLTFKHSESFDEDGVLGFIKNVLWADKGSMECPYIKRVEAVDWDAVEKALYNGTITKEQAIELDRFKTVKDTPTLNIGYVKKED